MSQTAEIIKFERPVVKAEIENGFTRIANELTEALMQNCAKLSGREFQIVQAIIHKTFRFHKKADWISNSQISELTGIAQSKISELKKSLIAKRVIFVSDKEIGINTTVSEWLDYPNTGKDKITRKRVTDYPNTGTPLPEKGEKLTPKRGTHKKTTNTKETITKEEGRAKRATRIPDIFEISPEMLAWAKSKNFSFDLNAETENFVLYWKGCGKPKADWKATWQVWMNRTQEKFGGSNSPRPSASKARPENFSGKDYGKDLVRF